MQRWSGNIRACRYGNRTPNLTFKTARTKLMSSLLTNVSRQYPPSAQSFALGLALTNECNLACSFCYRDPDRVDRLTLDQVRAGMERLPIRSVTLGTGPTAMHPPFHRLLPLLPSPPT